MTKPRRDLRGDDRPWGETTCAYGLTEPECTDAATRHFLWLVDLSISAACDKHAQFIRDNSSIAYEEHTFGGDCGMPGAIWQHPFINDDEGYCAFPAPDDASLLAEKSLELVEQRI
jgi:hypothetical protein